MVKHRKPKPNKIGHMNDPRNREKEIHRIAEVVLKLQAEKPKELQKAK